MKKIISIILCTSLLTLSLAGCSTGKKTGLESDASIQNSESELSEDVLVQQPIDSANEDSLEAEVTINQVPETEENKNEESAEEVTSEEISEDSIIEGTNEESEINWDQEIKFQGLADETLLPYLEDTVYTQLVNDLDSTAYFVEDVSAVYVSQEYLQEVAYNSQENIFFGYTLSEIDAFFEGTKYIFTNDENGQTIAVPLQEVEDTTYNQVLTNVAVGTGVILICVTVSAVTAGAGAPAVSMIFAVAAKTGATCALSGGLIGGVSAAMVRGFQTGDFKEALKAGALGASEGYKWGAITGALSGGASEAAGLYRATSNGLTMNEAALIQQESGFPLNVIKEFHNMKEYAAIKNAGLHPEMINGKLALVRNDIDLFKVDEFGRTNLQRMKSGLAPLDSTGKSFELHHIGQKNDGTIAILTSAEHDNPALHGFKSVSEIDRPAFDKIRSEFWKAMAKIMSGA